MAGAIKVIASANTDSFLYSLIASVFLRLVDGYRQSATPGVTGTVETARRMITDGVNTAKEKIPVVPDMAGRKTFHQLLCYLVAMTALDIEQATFKVHTWRVDGFFKRHVMVYEIVYNLEYRRAYAIGSAGSQRKQGIVLKRNQAR